MEEAQKKVKEAIAYIENALKITLEKEDQGEHQQSTYICYDHGKHTRINALRFKGVHFQDFDALKPVFRMVNNLTFVDCSIGSIVALHKLEYVNTLCFNNTKIPDLYQPEAEVLDTHIAHFRSVHFENMDIHHLSCLRPIAKSIASIHFKNCNLQHFSEINLLPRLSTIHIEDCTLLPDTDGVQHKKAPYRWRTSLHLTNMKLADFDAFLPIASHTLTLGLYECQLNSLNGIPSFSKLQNLILDTSTTVSHTKPSKKILQSSFQINECCIQAVEFYAEGAHHETKEMFDLENLTGIASCIQKFYLQTDKIRNPAALKHFTQLQTLSFSQANVDFNFFLPVAGKIKELDVNEGFLINTYQLKHYKQLTQIKLMDGYREGKEILPLQNLERLLPLSQQLKKLELWELDLKGKKCIEAFTALESLQIWNVSPKTAQSIFALPKLKKLGLDVKNKKACTLNLKHAKRLEALDIQSDRKLTLTGFKHLENLTWLEIDDGNIRVKKLDHLHKLALLKCDGNLNINAVGKMPSLKTLELDTDGCYAVKGLQQFPNLEKLKLHDAGKGGYLGRMNQLKILYITGASIRGKDWFGDLPKLKGLEICCETLFLGGGQLDKLKLLDLCEVRDVKQLEALTKLKRLKRINFNTLEISDAPLFNQMPRLKQLNVSGYPVDDLGIKARLDDPAILTLYGGPYIAFSVWKSNDMKL